VVAVSARAFGTFLLRPANLQAGMVQECESAEGRSKPLTYRLLGSVMLASGVRWQYN
jgi:hypothetical protein